MTFKNIYDVTKGEELSLGLGSGGTNPIGRGIGTSAGFDPTTLPGINALSGGPGVDGGQGGGGFLDSLLGNAKTGTQGFAIPGLEALAGIMQAYTGQQQLGLQKDAFNFNKDLTTTNLANQAQVTNASIRDQERFRREASGAYARTPQGQAQLVKDLEGAVSGRLVRGTI